MTFSGTVHSVHIAPAAAEPTVSMDQVRAVPGKGLEGDRYFSGDGHYSDRHGPDREVTLIEIETIEALERDHGLKLNPGDARRNIVTRGVPLNHFVGQEFSVGAVALRAIKLCEPCAHLASLTDEKVLPALVHRGGLRAQILSEGTIRPGDTIEAR